MQHADNPVHWHSWDDAALARARNENKPILVSIGYSTCHWCHVMERESFEDDTTAALMNEHFVCIKVDREERPDVDQIYMEACQAINGSGGWPLNAFLLPDGRPFYAGTYYPPEARYNRPGWKDVLKHLSDAYRNDRATVEEQAEKLTANIRTGSNNLLQIEPAADDHQSWRTDVLDKLRAGYDHHHGGFGGAPKFPNSQSLEALLAHGVLHDRPQDVHLAHHAALAMLDGGIYDQLGGGFSRYTVDAAWRVPHFEKMLYDNALLLRLLAKLHLARPDDRLLTAIRETTEWLDREMRLETKLYRAALDADSEGVEGKYYVWQISELEALLPPDQARLAAAFYGFTQAGNWAEERTNIPYRPHPLEMVAGELGLPPDVARAQLAAARKALHDYRFRTRLHPGADGKAILQWNALLVSGFCYCYRATEDITYLDHATELWDGLGEHLRVDGRWHRHYTNGHLGAPAFLDDLAALSEASLDLHDVTFDWKYVEAAEASIGTVLQRFPAAEGPMFQLRRRGDSELPVASVDLFDNALPSGNGQVMHTLLRLHRLTGKAAYLKSGEEMLAAMAGSLQRYPTSFGGWLHGALLHAAGAHELVVVGPGARQAARSVLSRYRPGLLVAASETAREDVDLFENRYLPDRLRYYVCEGRACHRPVDTLQEALSQLSTTN